VDDGWGGADEELPPLHTTVGVDRARTVIARNDSPDVPFTQSINPYRGCEHGCVYCYARPSHAYLGLSPGLDFETRLFAKPDAAQSLRAELARPGYRCQPIALGANTDPYQPLERRRRVTRAVLEVLAECRHPLSVVTKSALVERDLDLLAPMAAERLASVYVSITTLDAGLARVMEPRAAAPTRRLELVRRLRAANVPCGVLVAPLIPGLTDHELEPILEAAARAGANAARYILIRLPGEVDGLFQQWLHVHYPDRAQHVLSLLRQCRGGRTSDSRFGRRMRGDGPVADMLARRFAVASRRLGLDGEGVELDVTRFRPPARNPAQLALL
jgi:DNA repair photolyase